MLSKKIISDYLHDLANQVALGNVEVSQFKTEGSSAGTYHQLELEWNEIEGKK